MLNNDEIRQSFLPFALLKRVCVIVLCAALMATGSVILGDTTKLIKINDGEKNYFVRSFMGNVKSALCAVGLRSDNYEIVSSETTANTMSINIEYLFPVYITMGDTTIEHYSHAATVGEILASAGYTVDEFDMVYPDVDVKINETAYIDYTDIDYVSGSYTEAIACNTVTVKSASVEAGTEKLEPGTDGLQQVNYTDKYVNGKKVDTRIDGTVVLSEALDGKRVIGTKAVQSVSSGKTNNSEWVSTLKPDFDILLDENGVPLKYSKCIKSRATAYTYTGNKCSTGVNPQPGYIAVNPKYIPYGTKMYIKTADGSYIYGYAVAADTGGFIKKHPTGVDLFFTSVSACRNFGVRTVEIYILD